MFHVEQFGRRRRSVPRGTLLFDSPRKVPWVWKEEILGMSLAIYQVPEKYRDSSAAPQNDGI
jgi:hypothetical protein